MNLKRLLRNLKNLIGEFAESLKRVPRIKAHYSYANLRKVMISVEDHQFSKFIKLQTPDRLGVWNQTAFVTVRNPTVHVVINKINPCVKLHEDTNRNWLIHIEPPGYVSTLNLDAVELLKKFGRVYTSDPRLYSQGGRFIASPPYVHWHLGYSSYSNAFQYDYNFLAGFEGIPEKNVNLVAINSSIMTLPGHRLRAAFIEKICKAGLDFELHGAPSWSAYPQYKGRAADGKWPVYSRSRYVLAIENDVSDYYWTEKFTDAVLCFCMPIYFGSPRIGQYFPEGSYIELDITKETALEDLKAILASNYYERNIPNLIRARELILKKHNLFSFIDAELNNDTKIKQDA